MSEICPVCQNKADIASMQMTPELVEEMASLEEYPDFCGQDELLRRLSICNKCESLLNEMTCRECGCFVNFRARHLTAHCIKQKW